MILYQPLTPGNLASWQPPSLPPWWQAYFAPPLVRCRVYSIEHASFRLFLLLSLSHQILCYILLLLFLLLFLSSIHHFPPTLSTSHPRTASSSDMGMGQHEQTPQGVDHPGLPRSDRKKRLSSFSSVSPWHRLSDTPPILRPGQRTLCLIHLPLPTLTFLLPSAHPRNLRQWRSWDLHVRK